MCIEKTRVRTGFWRENHACMYAVFYKGVEWLGGTKVQFLDLCLHA